MVSPDLTRAVCSRSRRHLLRNGSGRIVMGYVSFRWDGRCRWSDGWEPRSGPLMSGSRDMGGYVCYVTARSDT